MTALAGLIEIDPSVADPADFDAYTFHDASLDGLLSRLIHPQLVDLEASPGSRCQEQPTILLINLEALEADLRSATRQAMAELFLAHGRR